jgi:hypothetical protein
MKTEDDQETDSQECELDGSEMCETHGREISFCVGALACTTFESDPGDPAN